MSVCFSFLATPWNMEFLGQGLDLTHSCDLSCSCFSAGSLTHCAGPGIEPESQSSREAADPIVPQRELLSFSFSFFFFFGHSHGVQRFLDQGSNLCHSSNPGQFLNPLSHQGTLGCSLFKTRLTHVLFFLNEDTCSLLN